jgi:hypothetical protein
MWEACEIKVSQSILVYYRVVAEEITETIFKGFNLLVGYSGGTVVSCHRHQWKYNLETGECLNRKSLPLRRFDLKIENNQILVSLVPISSEESVDFLASNQERK